MGYLIQALRQNPEPAIFLALEIAFDIQASAGGKMDVRQCCQK
jgi:hypothetical protein